MENTHIIEHIEKLDWQRILERLGEHGIKPGEASTTSKGKVTLTQRSIPELHPSEAVDAEVQHDPLAKTLTYKVTQKPESLSHEQIGAAIRKAVDGAKK